MVIINQSLDKVTFNEYFEKDLKLVVIGPKCETLPHWFFFYGSIETLIICSENLKTDNPSYGISYGVDIKNSFVNVPYFFLETALKQILSIDDSNT